jgi:predicted amidohydrolase
VKSANNGANLISTPETSNIMELKSTKLFKNIFAEGDDLFLKNLMKLANDLSVWINLGSWVVKDLNGKALNRTILIDSDGKINSRYDKIHLFDVELSETEKYLESKTYNSGDKAIISKTPFGKIGFTICYDLRFPYLYRDLAKSGAEIIFVPSAFTFETGKAHWHKLIQARAIETGSFIVAPAQWGLHENGRKTYGHSLVVNPWGEIIAEKVKGIGLLEFKINLNEVKLARSKIPSLKKSPAYSIVSN